MRPNFLVIGAQKCATSSLCYLLSRHPNVFITDPKEPYFFSHDHVWQRGWNWYESLFENSVGLMAVGEGSTTYTQHLLHPKAVRRIAKHLPNVKLIYIVRNPLERIESHYMHLCTKGGKEQAPFNEAVRKRPEYIDNSRYLEQIDRYRTHYADDKILVVFFEDFKSRPQSIVQRCFQFLGVAADTPIKSDWQALHVSAKGRVDGPLLRHARRVPLFSRVQQTLPIPLIGVLRRMFKKPIEGRPLWDESTRAWALAQLSDQSNTFLHRYGKPPDFWILK